MRGDYVAVNRHVVLGRRSVGVNELGYRSRYLFKKKQETVVVVFHQNVKNE